LGTARSSFVPGKVKKTVGPFCQIMSKLLKHDMIVANRGVTGLAFEKRAIADDPEAIPAIQILAQRIKDLRGGII